jgi:hypothetical protein
MRDEQPEPEWTGEMQEIAERGFHGTQADFDAALERLVAFGHKEEDADSTIMSINW